MTVEIIHADCREAMRALYKAGHRVDSIVTDPPYHLTSVQKRWANANPETEHAARADGAMNPRNRLSRGFMGKTWDGGDVAFRPETWKAVFDLLKPGGHLLAFSGTRTYHRMACAIEDAGFEIRDQIGWLYGSGFPKSHDVSKGIDRAAGAEREVTQEGHTKAAEFAGKFDNACSSTRERRDIPATEAAHQWEGWGTALKPAWEPIVLARKPLIGTVAANVQQFGTGAINVDGCRVEGAPRTTHADGDHRQKLTSKGTNGGAWANQDVDLGASLEIYAARSGRWPANVIHDGSEEVLAAFPDAGGQQAPVGPANGPKSSVNVYGDYGPRDQFNPRLDSGSAARFFYSAKADATDRLGSKHPTVKPIDLIAYLCRLITPPGGTVLDPFAGSGTTGMAAMREGFNAVLIEREAEYIADIKRRVAHVEGLDAPLFAEAAE
jgi:DNA modification methylase